MSLAGKETKETSLSLLEALKTPYQIITAEIKPKKGAVHAEVQMLSHILSTYAKRFKEKSEKEPVPIYIGISKLCCLNCRSMVEAANEIFKKENLPVTIFIRGRHDLDFGDNWVCPLVKNP